MLSDFTAPQRVGVDSNNGNASPLGLSRADDSYHCLAAIGLDLSNEKG